MATIGTVRPKEARIYDSFEGYHAFHAEVTQEEYGSFEVFWETESICTDDDCGCTQRAPGWYWWACSPGCVPDGGPEGPHATSRAALEDADEWSPEFDS